MNSYFYKRGYIGALTKCIYYTATQQGVEFSIYRYVNQWGKTEQDFQVTCMDKELISLFRGTENWYLSRDQIPPILDKMTELELLTPEMSARISQEINKLFEEFLNSPISF